MPRYTYVCTECEHKDIVKHGFDESVVHACTVCGNESRRDFIPHKDRIAFEAETPGVRARKNAQDERLFEKIQKARQGAGHHVDQSDLQNQADMYMFRKKGRGIAKKPSRTPKKDADA